MLYFFSQAYYFSAIEKIIGVEINADLCGLQQQIIENYSMADRVEVREIKYFISTVDIITTTNSSIVLHLFDDIYLQVKCADVCNELTLFKEGNLDNLKF